MGILQADRRFTGNPRIALLVDLKTLSINLKKLSKKPIISTLPGA